MPQALAESQARLVAEAAGTSGVYRIQLINPGWGSSGYYSPDVLAEAASSRVFPAGLHMYADHPRGDGSGLDGSGNRSVNDLWAVLASDATMADDGALVAEARVFGPYRELVDDMADSIGLSIRALGSCEMGEADGRRGQLITSIDEAMSVDFVTSAGRGGRILSLVESVRHDPSAQVALVHLVEATANDIRDALNNAVDEMYQLPEQQWCWVRDYDPDKGLVYFDISGRGESNGTYQQAYVVNDDGTCDLQDEAIEVAVRTEFVPVDPAGQTESLEDTMPQIEEARLRQLEADAGRVQTLESERAAADQRVEAVERQLAESNARIAARPIVTEVFAGHTLPAAIHTRVTESVVAGAACTDAGVLDEAALRTAATAARTEAEAEVAAIAESLGAGKPRGFGQSGSHEELQEAEDVKATIARRNAGLKVEV